MTRPSQTMEARACPCCGRPVSMSADLIWNRQERTLVGRGRALTPPSSKGAFFHVLWTKRQRALWVSSHVIAAEMFDCRDGGPDSAQQRISQIARQLRPLLAPFGLQIATRSGPSGGYHIIDNEIALSTPLQAAE